MQYPGVLPFYPIHGDANKLVDFGGALVVYMWCKGAPETFHDHIYNTFVKDEIALYFITSHARTDSELKKDGLVRRGRVSGTHAKGPGNMTFYFFSKENKDKSFSIDGLFTSIPNMQVEHAFKFGGNFHNMLKDLKEEVMNELIKRISEIKE